MCRTGGTVPGSKVPRLDGEQQRRIGGTHTPPPGRRPVLCRPSSLFRVLFPVLFLCPFLFRPLQEGLARHLVACSNPPFLSNDLFFILPRFIFLKCFYLKLPSTIFSRKQSVASLLKKGHRWDLAGSGILGVKRRGNTISLIQQGSQTARKRKIKTK